MRKIDFKWSYKRPKRSLESKFVLWADLERLGTPWGSLGPLVYNPFFHFGPFWTPGESPKMSLWKKRDTFGVPRGVRKRAEAINFDAPNRPWESFGRFGRPEVDLGSDFGSILDAPGDPHE